MWINFAAGVSPLIAMVMTNLHNLLTVDRVDHPNRLTWVWVHLPGFHLACLFLTHSHLACYLLGSDHWQSSVF